MPRKRAGGDPVTAAAVAAAFTIGAEVEVLCDEEGFWNSWYEATIARVLHNRRHYEVVFASLVTDDDPSCPLRESIRFSRIRPRAPRLATRFAVDELVDAFQNDGWWPGVVTAVHGGGPPEKYTICFPSTREVFDFDASEIRPQMEWRHGKWFPPGDEAGESPLFGTGKQIEVSGDKVKYGVVWFTGIIVKVIAKTILSVEYKKLKEDGSQNLFREIVHAESIRPVRPHLPEGKPFKVLDDIEACHCGGWAAGVVLKILLGSMYLVKLKYGKEEEMELHHSKIRICSYWINGQWYPLAESCGRSKRLNLPTSVSPSPLSGTGHLNNMSLKRKLGERPSREGQVEALQPCKDLKVEDLSSQLQVELDPKTPVLEAKVPASLHDFERPLSELVVRSPCVGAGLTKNLSFDLQNLRRSSNMSEFVASGLEGGPEQLLKTHDINHSWVNLLKQRKKCAIRKQKLQEQTDVNDVRQMRPPEKRESTSDLVVKSEERTEGVDLSKRDVPDEASNSLISVDVEENRSLPLHSKKGSAVARSNSVYTRRVGVEEAALIDQTLSMRSSEKKTLPFVKNSILWEPIEAMEVFRIMHQEPHFQQLEQYCMELREGMAIGMMATFATLVDNVKKLCIYDSQAAFEERLKALIPFEENGFDVRRVRSRIGELMEIRNNRRQCDKKKATLEEQIREKEIYEDRLHASKVALAKRIMEVEQQVTLLHEQRDSLADQGIDNASEIAMLQEKVQVTKEVNLLAEQQFDTILSSPW